MLTEKDYCDYGLIIELEQLGMPIKIDFACGIENGQLVKTKFYPNPPSLYEAQKWLREEKGILLQPTYLELSDEWICVIRDKNKQHGYSAQKQKNYEEALDEGIKEAVKILKEDANIQR